ncbi:hypothetical protein A0H81_00808 [Grifola frondosa]|uniref:N-acetyltransferase domain-containing protein n=1 Tax=Grifola frondosa TaxID=5627 RepID=A0A1C7MRZ6_GRIFR|nr:hypothetical protein A0H81_00808 [Grifola frondosa]
MHWVKHSSANLRKEFSSAFKERRLDAGLQKELNWFWRRGITSLLCTGYTRLGSACRMFRAQKTHITSRWTVWTLQQLSSGRLNKRSAIYAPAKLCRYVTFCIGAQFRSAQSTPDLCNNCHLFLVRCSCISIMSSVPTTYFIATYSSVRDLPPVVWDAFRAYPQKSNIMYPHAVEALRHAGQTVSSRQVWITCLSIHSTGLPPSIDFVLSCTEGHLGSYPVFIFTPLAPHLLDEGFLMPRISALVRALRECVPPERVFSIFAVDPVTRMFARLWTNDTGVPLDSNPEYYHAMLTYCTRQSLKPRQSPELPDLTYKLRLAVDADISEAARLCYRFAAAAEPFTLTAEQATREAAHLIRAGQLWVHEIAAPGRRPEIASIVAVTRSTDTVAAITKVFTNPNWRKRGCAERLTRYVCHSLLRTKSSVVLYVAHNNPAAAKVYDRVGFVGLSNTAVEGVDSWLELGFERSMVNLGHW